MITGQVKTRRPADGEPCEDHGKLSDPFPGLANHVHDGRCDHVQGRLVRIVPDLTQRVSGVVDEHHSGITRQQLRHFRPLVRTIPTKAGSDHENTISAAGGVVQIPSQVHAQNPTQSIPADLWPGHVASSSRARSATLCSHNTS